MLGGGGEKTGVAHVNNWPFVTSGYFRFGPEMFGRYSGKKNVLLILKGRYPNLFYSFIGTVGHNIWWENCRNGKNISSEGLKIGHFFFFVATSTQAVVSSIIVIASGPVGLATY